LKNSAEDIGKDSQIFLLLFNLANSNLGFSFQFWDYLGPEHGFPADFRVYSRVNSEEKWN
jgi:hypothetical protein